VVVIGYARPAATVAEAPWDHGASARLIGIRALVDRGAYS
jgi:hypothetical protein